MSVDVKTGEIVDESKALELAKKPGITELVKEGDRPLLAIMEKLDSLDWSKLKPHEIAFLLMQKPFMAQGGGTMYLSFKQALLFAVRAFELKVSPFSSEVWFDPNRGIVNLTLEGKRQVARARGIDLGPPKFEELKREWSDIARATENVDALKKLGFKFDVGVKASVRVGDPKIQEHAEYIAWLSEWFVERSPVWKSKPLHMLQTRACEKAISMALGTGASDPLADD